MSITTAGWFFILPSFLPGKGIARILWTTEVITCYSPCTIAKQEKKNTWKAHWEGMHHTPLPMVGRQQKPQSLIHLSFPSAPQNKGTQHFQPARAHAFQPLQSSCTDARLTKVTNLSQETSPLQGARFNGSDEQTAKLLVIERPRSKSQEPDFGVTLIKIHSKQWSQPSLALHLKNH